MKKCRAIVAVMLLAVMLLTTGCGAGALIQGSWSDSTGSLSMELGKNGKAVVTAYGIPLTVSYTYKDDVLTIIYSENITDTGTVTFFGDDEFIWEKEDSDGEIYQEDYIRQS